MLLFILSRQKPCFLHIPFNSSFLLIPHSAWENHHYLLHSGGIPSVQSRGWMQTKPRLTSHAHCTGFQFAIEQDGENKKIASAFEWEQRKMDKDMESHFPGYTTLHNGSVPYIGSSSNIVGMFFTSLCSWETVSTEDTAAVCTVWVATLRIDGGMWITTQAEPLLNYPSCLAFREGPLASKSESAGGTFCRWIANRAFCGGIRDAGPLNGSSLAGWGAGPRGRRVEGGHGGKGYSLDGAPLSRGKLL